jgi:predicted MFS family arabinose efflux permease
MRVWPRSLDVLHDRNYRRLFAGQAASLLGDGMVGVALAFAVLHLSHSPAALGLVLAARTLPLVVFLLVGGVFADRLPRRALMVVCDLVRVASQGAMAALLLTGVAQVWMLAALAAVGGTASAFFTPAAVGLLPAVVRPELLQRANALRAIAMAAGEIAGPIIAGVLVAGPGAGWALAADAASFGVSAAFLARLRVPPHSRPAPSSVLADLRHGWRGFRAQTWLFATVIVASLGNMLFAAFSVLGPLIAERSLGGAAAWASILAALGAGSVAGGVVALRVDPARPVLVATLAVALLPLPMALLAMGAPTAVIAGGALLAGVGMMLANTLWETTSQRHIPADQLSRVSSYDYFGSFACQPIGFAIWGPVAVAVGTSTALWIAFALQLASILALLFIGEIRRLTPYPPEPRLTSTS